MWALIVLALFQLPPAHVRLAPNVATVTGLTATHRRGQTFLTGTKNSGSSGSTTYAIRRSASAITSSSDGTLIATLDANSYRLLYDDNPAISFGEGQNLTTGLIVTDNGSHLASTKIFMVVTTGAAETGTWNYAAFSSDDPTTVSAGVNTASVAETYQAVPGGILLNSSVVGSYTVYRMMFWEDYSTWIHGSWGYYGHRVNVAVPTSGSNFAILLYLHGAPSGGYQEPTAGGFAITAVAIRPVENDWSSTTDPYTGGSHASPQWMFQFDTPNDVWKTSSITRLNRYVQAVRDNLTGTGVDFLVNPQRVYVSGGSMGSAGMHIAGHYPTIYTAANVQIPWIDNTASGSGAFFPNPTKKVNSASGETLANYTDMAYQASQVALPPIIHTFGAVDPTLSPAHYDEAIAAFETYHQPYYAEWFNDGHAAHDPSVSQWDANTGAGYGYLRYLLNEAYPAFGTASTSDTVPSFPNASAGKRNSTLDWHSSLHSISGGSAITDTAGTFAISLISSTQSTGTTVTIRNQQTFLPSAVATVTWTATGGQSGSATRNSDGSVTVTGLTINTTATRLSLASSEPAGHFATVFSSVIR